MRYLLVVALLLAVLSPVFAQHAANREWWQQTVSKDGFDPDRRLEQSVNFESSGHSATITLAELSKQTGVSLGVAPEDLRTVGERKLALFAKGVTLKSLMVRIPEALQECHWDVQPGTKPSYFLHRNSDMDATVTWLREREQKRKQAEARPPREARVKEALAAMTMTPEELDELAKTDPFLVQCVNNPQLRPYLETFAVLPDEKMAQFLDTGRIAVDYGGLAPELQQKMRNDIQQDVAEKSSRQDQGQAGIAQTILQNLSHSSLNFWDTSVLPSYEPSDPAIERTINITKTGPTGQGGTIMGFGSTLIESKYFGFHQRYAMENLPRDAAKPDSENSPYALWYQDMLQEQKRLADTRAKEWTEPTDPELLQVVTLGAKQPLTLPQLQQLLTQQTGLTVVSDYFTDHSYTLPAEATAGIPLWRLLYTICDAYNCTWQKTGRLLIFHRTKWFDMTRSEVPESLLVRCRQKLQRQGRLTLDDAAMAVLVLPDITREDTLPNDLQQAGLDYRSLLSGAWALRFYATLSPAQKNQATSAAGLAYNDMTIAQRQQLDGMIFGSADRAKFYIKKDTSQPGKLVYNLSLKLAGEKLPQLTAKYVFPKVHIKSTTGSMKK